MDLREYMDLARKWLWLFVLATAVAAVGAWIATLSMPKQYAAQTTLVVGRSTKEMQPNSADIYLSQDLAMTYAQMATREPVLKATVESLGLKSDWRVLKGLVKASAVPGTQFFEIRVIDVDASRAQVLADEVARQLIATSPTAAQQQSADNVAFVQEQLTNLKASMRQAQTEVKEIDSKIGLETSARSIADLQSRKTAREQQLETWRTQYADLLNTVEGSETNSLAVIEAAAVGNLVGPNARMNILFAAALGFGLALGAVLLIEYLDDTVKTTELLEKRVGLTGLGTIEMLHEIQHRSEGLVSLHKPRSPVAEAFRVVRTNLEFMLLNQPTRAVVVTSPNPGEGKSTTAANLAVVMAQGGAKVTLVDTDLRRPSLHRFFGLTNSAGLTSLLLDEHLAPDDVLQPVEAVPGLSILTSGPLPPNPSEVLKSRRTQDILDRLAAQTDFLILDSPPLLVVADAAILASHSGSTLLVLECGATRIDAVRKAMDVLAKVGVTPLGAVINKLEKSRVGGYYYYYQYSYRYRYGEYYGSDDHRDGEAGTPSGDGHHRHRHHRQQPATGGVAGIVERVRGVVGGLMD